MNRRLLFIALAAAAASFVLAGAQASVVNDAQTLTAAQLAQFVAQDAKLVTLMDQPDSLTDPPAGEFKSVKPHRYDPGDTDSVQAKWLNGTGCGNVDATNGTSYQDSVCTTLAGADQRDEENAGLLLAKGGPTPQDAAGFAELKNVKGITLSELGYDIRLLDYPASVSGSHCGAGAPRFDVYTTDGTLFFVGCRSPVADTVVTGAAGTGDAWTRLTWGVGGVVMGFCVAPSPTLACPVNFALVPITGTVQRIFVVFDEGTDTGPDYIGAAFLDNIDVNGQLVGKK
jgi:hypothetical protein